MTLEDITVRRGTVDTTGLRVTYLMGQGDAAVDYNAAAISNELYNLGATRLPRRHALQVRDRDRDVVFSYQLAPRSAADLVPAQ